jgi:hypothetical protein
MKDSQKEFLKLFFNEGEEFCVSPNKFGFHSIKQIDPEMVLIGPNAEYPEQATTEDKIILMAVNPIQGFRVDENATAFRSFLVEVDYGPLDEQLEYVKSMGMPYSTCVFSGNKSLHFGIVVDEDFIDEEVWRFAAQWILNIMDKADDKTKNPSRSIRFPDNVRPDGKKKEQTMIYLGKRISKKELTDWLHKHEDKRPIPERAVRLRAETPDIAHLPVWVLDQLNNGIDFTNGRSNRWYSLAVAFGLAGFSYEETLDILSEHFVSERDFKIREWRRTIKSGIQYAEGNHV